MANIIMKNKQGQDVTFTGVSKLTANKVGGGTQDFIIPSGTKSITANGTQDVADYASVNVNVPNPSTGKLDITDTNVKNVTNYAQAQVVDANLVAENIKKDVTILGITGTHAGGGGGSGPVNYVTFTAEQANSSVKIEIVGTLSPITLFYSTDNATWQPYTINTVITLVNIGDYVSLYGAGNWRATYSDSNHLHFVMTGKIAGSGDCNALLDTSIDGTISRCCVGMFSGCTSLTQAPDLPASLIAGYCYQDMFYGCTSLTQAPDLPATTLATDCYKNMFLGCTSLTQAPDLPATTLATYCYHQMFYGCTSLTQAPDLPATTLIAKCYTGIFSGCTSLTQAPELPATTLANFCYQNMFYGCTSLTQAPDLPATTLANSCYNQMFYGCKKLASVKTAATSWSTSYANAWLYQVASSGTVYCPADSTIPSGSTSGIPTGWSRVDWTPAA